MGAEAHSIFLVGAGRMGGALLRGWLAAGFPPGSLAVAEPNPGPEIAALLKENAIAAKPESAPDLMVLAVKPQIMNEVLARIAPLAGPKPPCFPSRPGAPSPPSPPISRRAPPSSGRCRTCPPRSAAASRQPCQCAGHARTPQPLRPLLRAAGEVAWIEDESLIDAVTAVSGSGPAYVFHLAECLADAAVAAGLPADLAARLARATVTGAGELLHRSPLSPAQLRENVTSPGGTTAAGLSVLMGEPSLKALIRDTVAAAARRSRELSS